MLDLQEHRLIKTQYFAERSFANGTARLNIPSLKVTTMGNAKVTNSKNCSLMYKMFQGNTYGKSQDWDEM